MGEVGRIVKGRPGYMGYIPSYELLEPPVKIGCATHQHPSERKIKCQTIIDTTESTVVPMSPSSPSVTFPNLMIPMNSETVYGQEHNNLNNTVIKQRAQTTNGAADQRKEMATLMRRDKVYQSGGMFAHQTTYGASFSCKTHEEEVTEAARKNALERSMKKEAKMAYARQSSSAPAGDLQFTRSLSSLNATTVNDDSIGFERFRFNSSVSAAQYMQTSYQRDIGKYGENPRDKLAASEKDLSKTATTAELQAGTAKHATDKRIPGYMGYVPDHERNKAAMLDPKDDLIKAHTRDMLRNTTNLNIPGYGGFVPKSVYNDTGRPHQATSATTTGYYYKAHPIEANKDHVHKNLCLKDFFATAGARDGEATAEMFYSQYRPKEGEPRIGAPNERKWISDAELKKTHIFIK